MPAALHSSAALTLARIVIMRGVIFVHYVHICGYALALFVRLYDFNAYRIAKKTARLISFFL